MRPGLFVVYWPGLMIALAVAQTQLAGAERIAAVGGVALALALLAKWQLQRALRAYRRDVARRATCDECGYTRGAHWYGQCPGGDPGDVFTRERFGLAR